MTPIWSFGECRAISYLHADAQAALGIEQILDPGVLFFGWWLIPIFPRVDSEVLTYIGEPLQLPTIEEPTEGEIDLWHGEYVQALGICTMRTRRRRCPGSRMRRSRCGEFALSAPRRDGTMNSDVRAYAMSVMRAMCGG